MLTRMWRKKNTPPFLWDCKGVQTLWKSVWRFLSKLGIVLWEDAVILLLCIYPGNAPTCNKDTYSTMFTAVIFIIARIWKQCRCPSAEEWIQKMWYIFTKEYYSAIKNADFTKFTGKWMDLENILLSGVTQWQKNIHGIYLLINGYYKEHEYQQYNPQITSISRGRKTKEWILQSYLEGGTI